MRSPELIESHLLHTFVVIAESKNLSDAAQRLRVTQSAVSQSLKHIESIVGVELIARRTQPVRMTHAGMILKQQADVILGDLRRLTTSVREASDQGLSRCRIGLVSSISEVFGVTLIRTLRERTERISLRSGSTPSLTQAFLNREIDVLVSDSALTEIEHIVRFPLFRDPMLLAIAGQLLMSEDEPLESIANRLPMIKYDRSAHIGAYTEMAMRRMHLQTSVNTETDDTHTLMRFVSEGEGWAVLSALCLAQAGLIRPGVTIKSLDEDRHSRALYLVAREHELGVLPTLLVTAMRDYFYGSVLTDLQSLAPWVEARMFASIDEV